MTYLKLQRKGDDETTMNYINTEKITRIAPVIEREWKGEDKVKGVVGTRIHVQGDDSVRVDTHKPEEILTLLSETIQDEG